MSNLTKMMGATEMLTSHLTKSCLLVPPKAPAPSMLPRPLEGTLRGTPALFGLLLLWGSGAELGAQAGSP